jgi:DNA-binding MarR family transcriptional regulator
MEFDMPNTQALDRKSMLTISLPALLPDGTDREFRKLVHDMIAFTALLSSMRDAHARRTGLAGVEFTVLISISHLSLDGEVNVKSIAEHLRVSGPFVTTVTRKLQEAGLLRKTQVASDRRRTSLSVTDAGHALIISVAPYMRELNDFAFAALDLERMRTLQGLITDMISSMEQALALNEFRERTDATRPARLTSST